jgi:dTDP-4-dehydrorhamnose reductase
MKAEAEERLLALGGTTVVRLTKVVGRTLPVIGRWRDSLDRGEPIRPFTDLLVAPVSLDLAAMVIAAAAREPLGPILQVSARADVSYADVATRLARRWGAAPDLVRPATVAELGLSLEHLPRHTTLDASAVRDTLGIEPPDPWAAIDEVA